MKVRVLGLAALAFTGCVGTVIVEVDEGKGSTPPGLFCPIAVEGCSGGDGVPPPVIVVADASADAP